MKIGSKYKVRYIYKDYISKLEPNAEEWQKENERQEMYESPTVILDKYVKIKDIKGIEEATPRTRDTFERKDVYLLLLYGEEPVHVVIEDVVKFLNETDTEVDKQ